MTAAWSKAVVLISLMNNIVFGLVPNCSNDFSAECLCGQTSYFGELMYVVNCTDKGFRNVSLLQNLPVETEVLIFSGNHIPELPTNIFGVENNYTRLKVIDFSNNYIREVKGKTFHRVAFVERLILNDNSLVLSSQHTRIFSNFERLKELHLTRAFLGEEGDISNTLHLIFINSSLIHLEKLHLEQNEISSFKDKRVFCDLPKLMDLHLGNNMIQALDFEISCVPKLRFLDLESNLLSQIDIDNITSFETYSKTNRPLTIDLKYNPFLCTCELMPMYHWMYGMSSNVTVRDKDSLYCTKIVDNCRKVESKNRIKNLKKTIECTQYLGRAKSGKVDYKTASRYMVVGIISVLIGIIMLMIAKQIGDQCKRTSSFISKVHYSVIGRQEDQETHV